MAKAKILSTGLYAPGTGIGNAELKTLAGLEFDADLIEKGLGIRERHIARLRGLDETTVDFAERAARSALAQAGIEAARLGLIIVATDTPEFISPATATLLQGRLQGGETATEAYDVNASCAGFVTALDAAARAMATDRSLEFALVVGVYNMPALLRPGDSFGWSIFADGAGAILLGRTGDEDSRGYVEGAFRSDGTQWDYIGVYAGGTRRPVTKEVLEAGTWGLELLKRLPGDRNLKLWPPLVKALAAKAGWRVEDVKHFIFTQINRSVIEKVMAVLERPMDDTTCVMDRYGYTGSGCLPMALHTALAEGRIHKGDPVVLVASGAGFAVGANLLVL